MLCDTWETEEREKCERNSPADSQVWGGDGQEALQAPEQRFQINPEGPHWSLWSTPTLQQVGLAWRKLERSQGCCRLPGWGAAWDPGWSSPFLQDCTLRSGPVLESFLNRCLCRVSSWRMVSCGRNPRIQAGAEGKVWGRSGRDWALQTPVALHHLKEWGEKKIRIEDEPGRRTGSGGKVFLIFSSHYSALLLMGNMLN